MLILRVLMDIDVNVYSVLCGSLNHLLCARSKIKGILLLYGSQSKNLLLIYIHVLIKHWCPHPATTSIAKALSRIIASCPGCSVLTVVECVLSIQCSYMQAGHLLCILFTGLILYWKCIMTVFNFWIDINYNIIAFAHEAMLFI